LLALGVQGSFCCPVDVLIGEKKEKRKEEKDSVVFGLCPAPRSVQASDEAVPHRCRAKFGSADKPMTIR
jgi:hypothetical protein